MEYLYLINDLSFCALAITLLTAIYFVMEIIYYYSKHHDFDYRKNYKVRFGILIAAFAVSGFIYHNTPSQPPKIKLTTSVGNF